MPKLDPPAFDVIVSHNEPVTMSDGTVLRSDVHRPAEGGPFPAVLIRNPYGEQASRALPVLPALEAGFAVVVQHCRGRGASDGEFDPWVREPGDGAETVDWITAQSWSDGTVTGYGVSYLAGTALQTAIERPRGYRAVVAVQTPADFYDGLNYHGGAFAFGSARWWATLQGLLTAGQAVAAGEDAGPSPAALASAAGDEGPVRPPWLDAGGLAAAFPAWRDWVDHQGRDDFWSALPAPRDNYARIDLPAYHVAGWFDLFLAGTLENYRGLRDQSPSEPARSGQVLVIGPWTHGALACGAAGELDFGMASTAAALRLESDQLAFLRAHAATGIASAVPDFPSNPDSSVESTTVDFSGAAGTSGGPGGQVPPRPPVRLFVMGTNVWRNEAEWPPARAVYTPFYLHPGGVLSVALPAGPAAGRAGSAFTFDPADPVPTCGGNLLLANPGAAGPRDQRAVEARPDVLSFTAEVLADDLEVTGPVTMTLFASTDARDADWTAKLVDVYPDGRAIGIADGIVRARFRDGLVRPEPLTPGSVNEFVIDLVATSQVFLAGHAIRVDISSSNAPRFDPNPGTGTSGATCAEEDMIVARQTVYHDPSRASHITLPVIPG
jgi:hypothetical protein